MLAKQKPKPRKTKGKESGARSTIPDAKAETVGTTATRAKAVNRSGNRASFSSPRQRGREVLRPCPLVPSGKRTP